MEEIVLKESGTEVTSDDLESFEKKTGLELPAEFKSFLLRNNGGYPAATLWTPSFTETDTTTGFSRDQETDVDQFLSLAEIIFEYDDYDGEGYVPASSVPFAYSSFGNLFLIRLDGGDHNGALNFANHDLWDRVHDSYTISLVSASFAEFLDALYVDEE